MQLKCQGFRRFASDKPAAWRGFRAGLQLPELALTSSAMNQGTGVLAVGGDRRAIAELGISGPLYRLFDAKSGAEGESAEVANVLSNDDFDSRIMHRGRQN